MMGGRPSIGSASSQYYSFRLPSFNDAAYLSTSLIITFIKLHVSSSFIFHEVLPNQAMVVFRITHGLKSTEASRERSTTRTVVLSRLI